MFIKRHSVKTDNKRTLFVVNVPCYCNKIALTNVFSQSGPIKSICISDRPGSKHEDSKESANVILDYVRKQPCTFKVAYVEFEDADSVDIAMKLNFGVVRYMSTQDKPVLTGIEKWMKQ